MLEQARTKFVEVINEQIEAAQDEQVRYHANISLASLEKLSDDLKDLDLNHSSARSTLAKAQTTLNNNISRISDAKAQIERQNARGAKDFEYEAKSQSPVPPISKKELESWRASAKVHAHDPYFSEHENIETMSENNFVEPEETETVTEETTDEPITEKTDEFVGEKDGIKVVKRDEDPGMGRSTITRFFFIHPDGSEEKIGSVAVASVRKKIENFLEA